MLHPPKRRSTLEPSEKIKKNKQIEYLMDLDKCLQIPNDDKLIIRRYIKDNDPHTLNIFEQFKKDKHYQDLQIKLRKYLQAIKNQQKRNHTLHQDYDNKTSDFQQRVYSQNSQQNSYKNSVKCSPQKEELKKKVLTLDITQLKQKIDNTRFHRAKTPIDNQHHSSIERLQSQFNNSAKKRKDISITKINTYVPARREKSVRRISNVSISKQNLSSSKNSLINFEFLQQSKLPSQNRKEEQLSKITIRPKDNHYVEYNQKQQDISAHIQKVPLKDISQNYSYSSSIRNMLISKIKQKQDPRKNNKIIIKQDKTAEKHQQLKQYNTQKQNNQNDFQNPTIIKKPAKPLHKDQPACSVRLFDQVDFNMPIYLNTENKPQPKNYGQISTARQNFMNWIQQNQIIQEKNKKEKIAFNNNYHIPKKQSQLAQQPSFGHFFQKIRKIMETKDS